MKAFAVRLTPEEQSLLRNNATARGLSMNRYVKNLISNSGVDSKPVEKSEGVWLLESLASKEITDSPIGIRTVLERTILKAIAACLPVSDFLEKHVRPQRGIPAGELLQMVVKVSPEFAGVTERQLADYIRKGCPSFEESAPGAFFSKVLFPAILAAK